MAAVAGDREEHDLITSGPVQPPARCRCGALPPGGLPGPGRPGPVRARSGGFPGCIGEVRAHLRQLEQMRYRHQREGWLLDAAAIYCDAVPSLAGHLASAQAQLPCPAGLPGLPGFLRGLGRVHRPGPRYQRPQGRPREDPLLHPHPGRPGRGEPLHRRSRLQRRGAEDLRALQAGRGQGLPDPLPDVAGDEPRHRPDRRAGGPAVPGGVRRAGRSTAASTPRSSTRESCAPTRNSSSTWPTWTTSGRSAPPGCASAIPRSPPAPRKSTPPAPSTWPWRASSSPRASRWSPTTSAWRTPSASSS